VEKEDKMAEQHKFSPQDSIHEKVWVTRKRLHSEGKKKVRRPRTTKKRVRTAEK
jgi:hypothetical protein